MTPQFGLRVRHIIDLTYRQQYSECSLHDVNFGYNLSEIPGTDIQILLIFPPLILKCAKFL